MYGDPFYLTLEERDKVYYADLSGMGQPIPYIGTYSCSSV